MQTWIKPILLSIGLLGFILLALNWNYQFMNEMTSMIVLVVSLLGLWLGIRPKKRQNPNH